MSLLRLCSLCEMYLTCKFLLNHHLSFWQLRRVEPGLCWINRRDLFDQSAVNSVSAVVMLSFVSKKIREKKESALHAGLHAGTWIFRTVVGV